MIRFKIALNELLAMNCIASKESYHNALCCVRIEPHKGRVHLIACNGAALGLLHSIDARCYEAEEPLNCLLPVPWLKTTARPGEFLMIEAADGKVHYRSANRSAVTITTAQETAVYPKWRQVIPREPFAPCPLSFDYKRIELFAKAAKILHGETHVHIYTHGKEKDAFSVFAGRIYGVVMPVRWTDAGPAIPQWALEQPEEPAAPPAPEPEQPQQQPTTETATIEPATV